MLGKASPWAPGSQHPAPHPCAGTGGLSRPGPSASPVQQSTLAGRPPTRLWGPLPSSWGIPPLPAWPDGTSHPRLSRKLCSGKLGVVMKVMGGLALFWASFTLGYVTGYFVHKCK